MNRTLTEIDAAFTDHYRKLLDVQIAVMEQLKTYPYDLSKTDITDAIIQRMNAFWHFNSQNNWGLLGRQSNPVSADFFTETCLLFFKTYFQRENPGYSIYSEKDINPVKSKKPVKPDLSIWKGERLVAAVELKVSSGWKGREIDNHLVKREAQIKQYHPEAWFGVLAYWNFFDPTSEHWGEQYFGLLHHQSDHAHQQTGLTVERLMAKIPII